MYCYGCGEEREGLELSLPIQIVVAAVAEAFYFLAGIICMRMLTKSGSERWMKAKGVTYRCFIVAWGAVGVSAGMWYLCGRSHENLTELLSSLWIGVLLVTVMVFGGLYGLGGLYLPLLVVRCVAGADRMKTIAEASDTWLNRNVPATLMWRCISGLLLASAVCGSVIIVRGALATGLSLV